MQLGCPVLSDAATGVPGGHQGARTGGYSSHGIVLTRWVRGERGAQTHWHTSGMPKGERRGRGCHAAAGAEDNGNGASSKPDTWATDRFQSSITLKRLLDASRTLGTQPLKEGEVPEDMGKGLRGLSPRNIGGKPVCPRCQALGSVECATCSCSGLYTDPILESQGVLVKVRCLGCGGSGAIMCPTCGGRGFSSPN